MSIEDARPWRERYGEVWLETCPHYLTHHMDMDLDSVQKAYSRWARVYDLVFGPAMVDARKATERDFAAPVQADAVCGTGRSKKCSA